ncbi:lysophospholipid acyltransferase family protein [Blastococcus haudaquaticus]|uniref:1-acyl-sn-glycerol-3-phosphate acyltransferases n=1 Tax=Blastococcus haudaquaticus TaxID=1938745 RepID=A0A286GIN4_9ACTN|nr:lysophospholipid acyltransferase family protein [Blastococcus haudaquaticus]SOD94834.1 1-acyl-sn-glycerol-3-phosphate acyltransferases [Blastococcus haudaquaticus]
MTGWFPVSSCTPTCLDDVPGAARATRARRWADVSRALAGAGRGDAASAAGRALAALGIVVQVFPPAVPWPGEGPGPLVVANHVSWVDDVALLALFPRVRPVAKAEVATWPVVGGWARRSGTVFLDRGSLRGLPASVAEVTAILRAGGPVLLHPEGTTACGNELGRFRPAFFQAAVDAGAPVCPVALRYRLDDGRATAAAGYFGGDTLRRSMGRVVGARGLVLEVHQLPALEPGLDRKELAALAEYAVAQVTEARPLSPGARRRRGAHGMTGGRPRGQGRTRTPAPS